MESNGDPLARSTDSATAFEMMDSGKEDVEGVRGVGVGMQRGRKVERNQPQTVGFLSHSTPHYLKQQGTVLTGSVVASTKYAVDTAAIFLLSVYWGGREEVVEVQKVGT